MKKYGVSRRTVINIKSSCEFILARADCDDVLLGLNVHDRPLFKQMMRSF